MRRRAIRRSIVISDQSDDSEFGPTPRKKKPARRNIILSSDEDLDAMVLADEDPLPGTASSKKKKSFKYKDKSTIIAEREERERMRRIAEKQKHFNGIEFDEDQDEEEDDLGKSLSTSDGSVKKAASMFVALF